MDKIEDRIFRLYDKVDGLEYSYKYKQLLKCEQIIKYIYNIIKRPNL